MRLDKALSKTTFKELVEKLAGKRIYIPKKKSNNIDLVWKDFNAGLKPDQIAERRFIDISTVYRYLAKKRQSKYRKTKIMRLLLETEETAQKIEYKGLAIDAILKQTKNKVMFACNRENGDIVIPYDFQDKIVIVHLDEKRHCLQDAELLSDALLSGVDIEGDFYLKKITFSQSLVEINSFPNIPGEVIEE